LPINKLDDLRSPLGLLLGKTRLEKELQGLSFAPDTTPVNSGNVVLRGVPRKLEERVNEVLLEVTPDYRIARIVIQEVDGSTTEFRFTGQQEDLQIADQQFRFSSPPGVEIVSGELGQ
jgi:outer membrane lipoprotein-sorting protein